MRTFLLAFASVLLVAVVCAEDWYGCPDGTKFDGWVDDESTLVSGCHNGAVRSNYKYVEGRLPHPVCCAPIGRGRRAAEYPSNGNGLDALPKKAPKTNGTSKNA